MFNILLLALASAQHSGMRSQLSQSCLNQAKNAYLPGLLNYIKSTPPQDTEINVSMGLTSKTIKLTNFTYNALEINVPDSTLEFGYDYTNMLLKMPNTTVSIDVTYSTWWFGEATGQVTVDIDKANIQLPILLNLVDGRMSVQIDTNAIADQVEINVNTNSWFFWFIQVFTDLWPIDWITEWMFGTMFSNAAAFVNPALAQMMNSIPYDVEVMNNLNLNYHINEYSFPYNQFLEANFNATFYSSAYPRIPTNSFPAFSQPECLEMQISQYTFKTLLYALYESRDATMHINGEDVTQITMTTNGLYYIVPNLYNTYGKNKYVNLECGLSAPGDIQIQSQEMMAILDGYCDFYVEVDNVQNKAFRLFMELELGADLTLQSQEDHVKVVGQLDKDKTKVLQFNAQQSRVGTINTATLSLGIYFLVNAFVGASNIYLEQQGLILPLPQGLMLSDSEITYQDEVVAISAIPEFESYFKNFFKQI